MTFKAKLFALALAASFSLGLAACGSDEKTAQAPAADAGATAATAASPPTSLPPPPQLKARSFIVLDHDSGRVLAALDPDSRQEPASLTKLMTAYGVFKALKEGRIKLTDMATISEHAWRQEGSRMFIEVGKQVSVDNLIQGMIVQSGNDATVALAELVGGTEQQFAAMMNTYAKQLGMTNSHFTNSPGMPDPEHYMTARDAAILASALIHEFPEYYKVVCAEGIRLERHHAAESQRPAVARPDRGRSQDRPYGDCRVTASSRRPSETGMRPRVGRARTGLDAGTRGCERGAAELWLQLLRDQARLRGCEPLTTVRVWKGKQSRLGSC
jgi:D-alanyl-D-alanine carboxypeptidase (penicillin-binding protein 5/6)